MRWFWIDRFVEFVSGERAAAIKNVTLDEEAIDEYVPWFPVFPTSLIIEGMAQCGGLLVGEHNSFRERVVLAKIGKATFHFPARPGDTLVYTTEIEDIRNDGAICRAVSHVEDRVQAEAQLVFAHLDDRFEGVDLFLPSDFLRMMRMLGLYDVGRMPDGRPLTIPPHLLKAELADLEGLAGKGPSETLTIK
ncbi:MAG: 3-hydroxyacyl-ACP dehydratase FabZ family protein [Pirellulaceae bacterium]